MAAVVELSLLLRREELEVFCLLPEAGRARGRARTRV